MAKVTVTSGNVTVESEGQKQLFETLAEYQEVFSVTVCKGCKGNSLRFSVRTAEDKKGKTHKYYELRCQECFAKLIFGQHENGKTLFPKDWVRWNPSTKAEETL